MNNSPPTFTPYSTVWTIITPVFASCICCRPNSAASRGRRLRRRKKAIRRRYCSATPHAPPSLRQLDRDCRLYDIRKVRANGGIRIPKIDLLVHMGLSSGQQHPDEWLTERRPQEGRLHANTEFYRSTAWRKLRAVKLAQQPLCEECLKQGRHTPAQMVDHIRPINKGGAALDLSNLQSLCHACHNSKSARERK